MIHRAAPTDPPVDLVVHSATLVDAEATTPDGWLAAADGTVVARGAGGGWRELPLAGAATVVDGSGRLLTPGLIDVHCHGGGGHTHDDGADAIRAALGCHRAHGTTRSVVSIVTGPLERMAAALGAVSEVMADDPTVLGAHAEGPFLHPARRGAHAEQHLRAPSQAVVEALLDAAGGDLRQLTLAPELPGALDLVARLVDAGVIVAVGHTDADLATTQRAFDAGVRLLTHAYNGMRPLHHRRPGPAVAALNDPRVCLEVIADGHHVHPELVRTTFAAAPGRVALVTDAMAGACCGDGAYRLGDVDVDVRAGVATVAGSERLAGSTLTQDRALRLAVTRCGIEPRRAVEAATLVPARLLGCDDRLGLLRPGYLADLVLFDPDWRVERVWVAGVPVVSSSSRPRP